MAAKKSAAVTTDDLKTLSPVQDGVRVVADREEPSLDPALEKIRDEEAKALTAVEVQPREEPTLDPALEAARDAEIKRQADAVAAASGK